MYCDASMSEEAPSCDPYAFLLDSTELWTRDCDQEASGCGIADPRVATCLPPGLLAPAFWYRAVIQKRDRASRRQWKVKLFDKRRLDRKCAASAKAICRSRRFSAEESWDGAEGTG